LQRRVERNRARLLTTTTTMTRRKEEEGWKERGKLLNVYLVAFSKVWCEPYEWISPNSTPYVTYLGLAKPTPLSLLEIRCSTSTTFHWSPNSTMFYNTKKVKHEHKSQDAQLLHSIGPQIQLWFTILRK
jgi:hypothetical protein